MSYISLSDYTNAGYLPVEQVAFDTAKANAEIMVNCLTSFYDPAFGYNSLADDSASPNPQIVSRAKAFKRAIAMQTNFILTSKITSAYDAANQSLTSFSVGHTSMNVGKSAAATVTLGTTGLTKNVVDILSKFGLLYTGVDHL